MKDYKKAARKGKSQYKTATDPNLHTSQCIGKGADILNDHSHYGSYCHKK